MIGARVRQAERVSDYRENEIVALTQRLVEWLRVESEADPLIKAAALRAAAEVQVQAVTAQTLFASLRKMAQ